MDTQIMSTNSLRDLAEQKEEEWKQIRQLRSITLETECKEKEKQLIQEHTRYVKLKEDFKYNLKLLDDRDKELTEYDIIFKELKVQLSEKQAEISEIMIKIDQLETSLAREQQSNDSIHASYQQRLQEKQAEIESYRRDKDKELQKERDELENYKRDLNRRVGELENELTIQKQEMNTNFDDTLRKREHEYHTKIDEISSQCLSYEIKVKLLNKELELVKSTQKKNAEEFSVICNNHSQLEKKLKHKEWEKKDSEVMKDAKISDLECKYRQNEHMVQRMKEDFNRKCEELRRDVQEKQQTVMLMKESNETRELELHSTIRQIQSNVEKLESDKRHLEWTNADLIKNGDAKMEKLQQEIFDLKNQSDQRLADDARGKVAKDVAFHQLKEDNELLRGELLVRKEDIERYRKDVNLALERQSDVEREKAQLHIDWQKRFEDGNRHQYEKAEDLVKNLMKAKDEAQSKLQVKIKEIEHYEKLVDMLRNDHKLALATLKMNGLSIDSSNFSPPSEVEEIQQLKLQNNSLISVIKQMRQEMEDLANKIPSNDGTANLDQEKSDMRHRNEVKGDIIIKTQLPHSQENVNKEIGDSMIIKDHVRSLNEAISVLRSEKVELSAQVRKQQAKILHLETLVDQLSKKPREKQVEVDHLQYEVGVQQRRYQTDVASLQHRLSQVELELTETRKEADEYYRGNLDKNMELTALSNEISNLKMMLAAKSPSINFGAQELLIQQLQDEITHLHQKHNLPMTRHNVQSSDEASLQLHEKLRLAAKYIHQLSKEKQQLIELSNRLRNELMKAGIAVPTAPAKSLPVAQSILSRVANPSVGPSHPSGGSGLRQKIDGKLSRLENLQYELTKQQLAFVQKEQPTAVVVDVASSSDTAIEGGVESFKPSKNVQLNTDFTHSQRTSSPANLEPLHLTISSVGGESIQDVWKLLDDGQSIYTSRITNRSQPEKPSKLTTKIGDGDQMISGSDLNDWTVKGKPSKIEDKLSKRELDKRYVVPAKNNKTKQKFRNYNIKD